MVDERPVLHRAHTLRRLLWRTRFSRLGTFLSILVFGVYVLLVVEQGGLSLDKQSTLSNAMHRYKTTPERDPYALPGYLNISTENPLDTSWVTLGSSGIQAPDWLGILRQADNSPLIPSFQWNGPIPSTHRTLGQRRELDSEDPETQGRLQEEALQSISHLRNSTILLIGDSVDRNFLDQFAWIMQAERTQESFSGDSFDPASITSWGLPHTVNIRSGINLKLANLFVYGAMDETDEFGEAPDWLPPGRAEDRVDALFKPFTNRLEHPIALIQVHTGLWDLAYFGREDKRLKVDTSLPLSKERLEAWRIRTTSMIRKIQSAWPGVPIVFRMLHRVGDSQEASRDYGGFTNFFTNIRTVQIRHMQRLVAHDTGIAVFDFGAAFEGYQQFQEKVHPLLWPAGVLMSQALLHQAYLAKTYEDYNRM